MAETKCGGVAGVKQDGHVVSVVIPTLGRETLVLVQDALGRQTRPADEVLIILDRERQGVSWGRNTGILQAKGDLIAFIDDDAIPPDDWLERLIQAFDAYGAHVAGGTFQETDPLLDAIRRRRPMPDRILLDTGGWVGNSGNIMFARVVFDRLLQRDGYLFSETFKTSGEDWELMGRVRRDGARAVYVPNPVRHLRRATSWHHCRHSFQRGIGIAKLFRFQRQSSAHVIPQDSLLWGQAGKKAPPRWFAAIWQKLVGPFDIGSFEKPQHFIVYWLGEKCQALGFLWGLLTRG